MDTISSKISTQSADYKENKRHNAGLLKVLKERQDTAHKTLKDIRERAGIKKGEKFDINPEDIDMI